MKDPLSVNRASDDGFFPLALAAFLGQEGVARLLLANGAAPDVTSANQTRVTPPRQRGGPGSSNSFLITERIRTFGNRDAPLPSAAFNGDEPTGRLLLDRGASAQALDDSGKMPVDLARERGHVKVAGLF